MFPVLVSGLKRFAKGFVAGGVGSVLAIVSGGVSFASLGEAKHLGLVLLGAFVTGGLLAVEKMYNFQP